MVLATPAAGVGVMTPGRVLDVTNLPDFDVSNRSPLFSGQLLVCAIEGSLFFVLIGMYFYLRLQLDVWPPPGVKVPSPSIATWGLIPLLASCAGSYWASDAAKKNDRKGMIRGMAVNLILASAFLVLRAIEWGNLNFTWASDAHGSIVWSMLFLHSYDVVADLLFTSVLLIIVAAGKAGPKQRIGVHVDSVVWYFLAGIWLPMYAVIVWGPRMIGTPR
jgi:heme/copper-type cytochrome/quinol oxidase subunit 3